MLNSINFNYGYEYNFTIKPETETLETDTSETQTNQTSVKVRAVVIMELLKKLQLGTAHNDLSKICKLISLITGNSFAGIYKDFRTGIEFKKYHIDEITQANKILQDINSQIQLKTDKQY